MGAENKKIKDTDIEVSAGSRADRYWRDRGFRDLYKSFRKPGMSPPAGNPYETVKKKFKVKALEFGNWVPIEMRYNYLVGTIVAMHDIKLITRLRSFGLNVLSVAYGARGSGQALAHYEAFTRTINITRYPRGGSFAFSGGVGSLAHEYGHFLDYYYGIRSKNQSGSQALSGGQSTVTTFSEAELKDPGPWGAMSRLLQAIIWKDGEKTDYYLRVRKIGSDYWYRRNELFARCFEQFIQVRLNKKGIDNTFLTKSRKYDEVGKVYMKADEFKRIEPLVEKVLVAIRKIKV